MQIIEDGYGGNNDPIDKLEVASSLRSAIEHYTELTVDEHMSGKLNKDADKAWKKIEKLINKLTKEK